MLKKSFYKVKEYPSYSLANLDPVGRSHIDCKKKEFIQFVTFILHFYFNNLINYIVIVFRPSFPNLICYKRYSIKVLSC